MAKPGPHKDIIVSEALNHAASIRRTLWMQEFKRKHGRVFPSRGEGDGELRGCDTCPPLLDGPIYSTDYWRAWKSRSRAADRGGGRRGHKSPHGCAPDNGIPAAANGADKRCASARSSPSRAPGVAAFCSSPYGTPTSSFTGGRCGTQIFAAVSGDGDRRGDGGIGLLRAHHDAVIKPLLRGDSRSPTVSSSSVGVRLSHSNPRGEATGSSERSSGDGMYDIALADKVVMRATPSCSFKSGAASASESAVQGISRDTPGAIYNPNIRSNSAAVPAVSFSSSDRFAVGHLKSETPGPGHYQRMSAGKATSSEGLTGCGAVAWTGVETFMDSCWSRPAPPPHLRPWQGFGNGCSVAEHIGYGACLDGRCCARHSIEKRNALRVVQFLGRRRPRGGRGQAGRRRSLRCRDASGGRVTGHQQSSPHRNSNENPHRNSNEIISRPVSALSPSSSRPVDEESAGDPAGDTETHFHPIDTEIGHVCRTAVSKDSGEASPRGVGVNTSSTLREPTPKKASSESSSPDPRRQGNTTVRDFPVDDGTADTSVVSSTARGGESAGAAGSEDARAAGRKRTPLHFAAERGELSLVDRLCDQGDNRNAVDERGYTPLHDAADKGNTRVVSRLLQGNESTAPEPATRGGIFRGKTPKVSRQVAADPNVQDSKGRTPLYLACFHGHERAVRALLDAGACPDLVDIRGKPAQEVAGAQKIYQLLQFKTDVSLVKANIAALEERERSAERQQRRAAQARAVRELADLKAEELRLRAAVDALEKKRASYAAAAKRQC